MEQPVIKRAIKEPVVSYLKRREPQINLPKGRINRPLRVGELTEEFSKIFKHPDRDRVLSELFRRYL